MPPTKVYRQSSASIRTEIPITGQIRDADTRTRRPLPELLHPTPHTTKRQTERAALPRPKRQRRWRHFALPAPSRPASGRFRCRSLCLQRWPPKPTGQDRAQVPGAFRSYPAAQEIAARSGNTRLAIAPAANVTHDPINTYQVNATVVNRAISNTAASPKIIPVRDPFEFDRESNVPRKNNPSRLPNVNEAMVSPASSTGPQFTNPRKISTMPHTSVIRRDNFMNFSGSRVCPRNAAKSITLLAAREFSEPLAFDMATARMAASSNPASPVGISRTRNSGRIRSVDSPAASKGWCCANTYSNTPTSKNTVNWNNTMIPLLNRARRLSVSLRAASNLCTMV